jgi:hypothetical protein
MAAPVALKCPSYASPLRAEDLDVARGLVKCSYCQALMTLPASAAPGPAFRPRPEAPLPSRVSVADTGAGVELRLRWFTPVFLFLLAFCVAWDGFLVFWYSLAMREGAPWIMAVFPLLHVAAGAALTYVTLTGFVNSTVVRVDRGRLSVRHGPLPWAGNRDYADGEVEQLYCKERVQRGKRSEQTTYEVWAVLAGGRSVKLLSAVGGDEQALFLEQRLERALGLQDRPVAGELAR